MAPFSGCGIAGIILKNSEIIPENLKIEFSRVMNSLRHRGPDGEGIYCKQNALLGHRRLSIIDVSSNANQPMIRDNSVLTYNGEIYNFQDIRKTLKNLGYNFSTDSDTEVVLYSIQKWGQKAFDLFNGMFALAHWDEKEKCLLLARDRLGKKPLYYYSDNEIFAFASEIEALLIFSRIKKEIDIEAFEHQLFATSFLETDCTRTLIKGIKSIAPGHIIRVFSDGKKIDTLKYWEVPEEKTDFNSDADYIDELESLLKSSISLRMISDVPVTAFLSGGIDSSLINFFASKYTDKELTCVTINYTEGGRDLYSDMPDSDLIYSKKFINQVEHKLNHKIIELRDTEITLGSIDKIIDLSALSDDDRMLSIIKNYECINNLGYKVVLNGQGADELMCGYLSLKYFYETMFDVQSPGTEIIHKMFPTRTIAKSVLNRKSVQKAEITYKKVLEYYNSFKGNPDEKIHKFLIKTQLLRILKFEDYLSMQHSVECRLPYLDYRIVEFAFKIPYEKHYITETRTGKSLLRKITGKYLSSDIANRPKQAFPVSRNLQKYQLLLNLFRQNQDKITGNTLIKEYFDIRKLKEDKNLKVEELWLLIVIWRWYEKLNLKQISY